MRGAVEWFPDLSVPPLRPGRSARLCTVLCDCGTAISCTVLGVVSTVVVGGVGFAGVMVSTHR